MALEAGTKVGRYTISRLLAQGGMAEVYRAEQELTSGITRPVAVKVIRPEYSESPDFREMFLDEARTACTLSHPNIVHIYEVGETDDGLLYMAMELVPGETLSTIVRSFRDQDERFSDEAIMAIGISTCSALEAVHALKVEGGTVNLVHRDVSPHNLLLSSAGALKLIDFGIAKAATNRNLTMPGVTKGKAGYFSPEQAMGKRLDGRSDLFSLGVTLYKLASGGTPFDDFSNHVERHTALVRGNFQRLADAYPGLPEGLYDVVDRALKVKPEDRFQTAREMREALEKAAFDAGLRVGQSSLLGYVDAEGEISTTGGTRSKLTPIQSNGSLRAVTSTTASRPSAKAQRDVVTAPTGQWPEPGSRRTFLLAGLLFVAAIIAGVFGMLLAFGPKDTVAVPPLPPRVVVAPPPPAPPKPQLRPPPPVEPLAPTPPPGDPPPSTDPAAPPTVPPGATATPTPTPPVTAPPPPKPVVVAVAKPPEPKPVPVRIVPDEPVPRTPRGPRPEPKEAKPPEDAAPVIPPGEGKLRVGATDPSAVAAILVGAEDWGSPPVNRRVSSGMYTVTLKLADGKKVTWKGPVQPDRTTALLYDVGAGRWTQQ